MKTYFTKYDEIHYIIINMMITLEEKERK